MALFSDFDKAAQENAAASEAAQRGAVSAADAQAGDNRPVRLKDLHCDGCGKQCSLDAPGCGRGMRLAEAAMRGEDISALQGDSGHAHGEHGHGHRGGQEFHSEHSFEGRPHRGGEDEEFGRGHDDRAFRHGPRGEAHGGEEFRGEPHRGGQDHRGPHHGGHRFTAEEIERTDDLETLMRRCGHHLHHNADRGQGSTQAQVLQLIAANPGLSQRQLQEQLRVQPGSVSELLSKLENKGLIARERADDDRRCVLLSLTPEGRSAAAQAGEEVKADLFAALSDAEKASLRGLLKKVLLSWMA